MVSVLTALKCLTCAHQFLWLFWPARFPLAINLYVMYILTESSSIWGTESGHQHTKDLGTGESVQPPDLKEWGPWTDSKQMENCSCGWVWKQNQNLGSGSFCEMANRRPCVLLAAVPEDPWAGERVEPANPNKWGLQAGGSPQFPHRSWARIKGWGFPLKNSGIADWRAN